MGNIRGRRNIEDPPFDVFNWAPDDKVRRAVHVTMSGEEWEKFGKICSAHHLDRTKMVTWLIKSKIASVYGDD